MTKVYFHVDLDAFFASVEQLDHPEYRGKPVIVGGEIGDRRSVVSTASYEARKFGVHSAMPTYQAVKLCPSGIFIHGNMRRYQEKSREVMSIFYDFSPDVQQMSVDEAFIDMTGTEKLFGPPEEAAKKLKQEVLSKTGLTVSIGIASTKYCAKIASGLQKPDGLFIVQPGAEKDFMLSLPLDKLWGAGKKTQERLRNYGITTTKEIYNRSLPLLQSIFGEASGLFLYNAVRGAEYEDFNTEPKSRSISAETTYEYDLTDIYAMETALLELCQTVMFRSLREKVRSKSISIKIRYEDFSTVSIQETSERYISSADELFERVKNLFSKKYNSRFGIRLFGVCMQHLEDDTKPRPSELFDFGEEKKRRLEQAILKAEQKDPSLKITRARLLKKGTSYLLLLSTLFFSAQKISAQEASSFFEENQHNYTREADGASAITFDTSKLPPEQDDSSSAIFQKNLFGKELEIEAEGFWKSSVTMGGSYSFGFDTTPSISFEAPVFEQNVDLTVWLLADKKWYFEAAFADEFENNTVAAGYRGDGYLKHFRIGNRGITFPESYSISDFNRSIGGGNNQSPGLLASWKGSRWNADAAIRYDMLTARSKTWYGKNSVTENTISLSAFNTGTQYVLPSSQLSSSVKNIYVQSATGSYKDSKGRKYIKLDSSQYLLQYSENQLFLSKDAKAWKRSGTLPAVAVSFDTDITEEIFKDAVKNSQNRTNELENFFDEIKKAFPSVKIEDFFYTFTSEISEGSRSEKILYLQHPSGFSPFMDCSRYDAGIISADDAAIASANTATVSPDYSAVITDDEYAFTLTDFFSEKHTYIDVYKKNEAASSEPSISRSPFLRFPFARENPYIYLTSDTDSTSDLVLRIRSYTAVSRFEIGTKAVPGTVQVYKNNILDSASSYDSSTGSITLSSSVSNTDRIHAIWWEEDDSSENSSIAMAAGFIYNFTEKLTADVSLALRLPFSSEKNYADSASASSSYGTAATSVQYTNAFLTIRNSSALTRETVNSTGTYRIFGMDSSDSETHYLSKTAAKALPEAFTPVLNSKNSVELFPLLEEAANKAEKTQNGLADAEISGYAVPFSWNFDSESHMKYQWAAQTISIPGVSSTLNHSTLFEIALKNTAPLVSDFDVYLQLGVSEDEDFDYEDSEKIPTWKISEMGAENVSGFFDTSKTGWQNVSVELSLSDRSFLSSSENSSARLIIIPKNNSVTAGNKASTILAGPYQCNLSSFTAVSPDEIKINSYEQADSTLQFSKIKDFNSKSTNSAQFFDIYIQDDVSEEEILLKKYFSPVDFSNYGKLNFYIRYDSSSEEDFPELDFAFKTLEDDGQKTALKFAVSSEKLSSQWQKVEVNLSSKKVTVGKHSSSIFFDSDTVPSLLEISSSISGTKGKKMHLALDEFFLTDAQAFSTIQDKISFTAQKNGAVFCLNEKEILKNVSLKLSGDGAKTFYDSSKKSNESLKGQGELDFTLTNIIFKLSAAANHSKASENESSFSHNISTEKPFFGILSVSEDFNYDESSKSLQKENGATINFSRIKIPLQIDFSSSGSHDSWSKKQKIQSNFALNVKSLHLTANAKAEQRIETTETDTNFIGTSSLFSCWKEITEMEFSTGKKEASKRAVSLAGTAKFASSFFGLTPALSFETKGQFKASENNSFKDDSTIKFELPFKGGSNSFSINFSRTAESYGKIEDLNGYEDDFSELSSRLNDKNYLFTSIPFYDFFDESVSSKVKKSVQKSDSTLSPTAFYSSEYSFNWKRGFAGNKYDFFFPRSSSLVFSRDIRASDSVTDIYQIKNKVNFSSLNVLGRFGTIHLFDFFEQDEHNSSITAAVKFPADEKSNLKFVVSGYQQSIFYISDGNSMTLGLEGSVEAKSIWDGKGTIVWKRAAKSSLAKAVYDLIKKNDLKAPLITLTDSLNIGCSSTESVSKVQKNYSAQYTHQTDTKISKFVTINSSAGIGYSSIWDKIAVLNGTLTLGATIQF